MSSAVASRLAPVLKRFGARVEVAGPDNDAACVVFSDGRRSYFRWSNFDLNGAGASDVTRDKHATFLFLKQLRYPIPETARAGTADDVLSFGTSHGYPVVVKPNFLSEGRGVSIVHGPGAAGRAWERATALGRGVVVQAYAPGRDLRTLVFDGDLIAAYWRNPPSVRADGELTMTELYRRWRTQQVTHLTDDTLAFLDDQWLRDERVPPRGDCIALAETCLGSTGTVVDISDALPASLAKLSTSIGRELGLRVAGIDLRVDPGFDPTHPPQVLEVNSAPETDGLAASGADGRERAARYYERVALALVEQWTHNSK